MPGPDVDGSSPQRDAADLAHHEPVLRSTAGRLQPGTFLCSCGVAVGNVHWHYKSPPSPRPVPESSLKHPMGTDSVGHDLRLRSRRHEDLGSVALSWRYLHRVRNRVRRPVRLYGGRTDNLMMRS